MYHVVKVVLVVFLKFAREMVGQMRKRITSKWGNGLRPNGVTDYVQMRKRNAAK